MSISDDNRSGLLAGWIVQAIQDRKITIGNPAKMLNQAVALFKKDGLAALKSVGNQAAASGFSGLMGVFTGKIGEIANDIGKRGPGAVFEDLQAQYARGAEANAKRKVR